MRHSRFITAKELEDVVELDERHIRRPATQRRLGIDSCRDQVCSRPLRWHRDQVRQRLCERGFRME